ncbi:unnamed protein product [Closterium sp. Yama58-4]|nr:unnamed protein product [Closterium sp. Yama58-4]
MQLRPVGSLGTHLFNLLLFSSCMAARRDARCESAMLRVLALALATAASVTVPCSGAVTNETQALRSMAAQWQAGAALASWQVYDVCAVAGGATGITCQDGSVTALSLSRTTLSGPLPGEIGVLTALTLLSLSRTNLSGPLPGEIGDLTALTLLDLSYNSLNNAIPYSIGNLARLQSLVLKSNAFNGSLPDALSGLSSLLQLDVQRNVFSGSLPFSLFSLTTLSSLYMDGNQLSGTLPSQVGALTNLFTLQVSNNKLNGSPPATLSLLSSLHELQMNKNSFSGPFPSVVTALTNLTMIYASNNSFVGPFPAFLGDMTHLAFLKIYSNKLRGTLPQSYSQLRNLTHLDLRDMQLYGALPTWLGLLTRMQYLHFRNNDLSGAVPESMGNLTNLIEISLIGNPKLNGTLPACWANIISLGTIAASRLQFACPSPNMCCPTGSPIQDLPFCVNFCPQYCSACAPGMSPAVIAGIAVGCSVALLAVLALALYIWYYRFGPGRIQAWERELDRGFRKYTWREIMDATDSFSEARKLGKGGFGTVYLGQGDAPHQLIAVKHAAFVERSSKIATMFEEEVKAVSRLHHKNLVRLLGYCNDHMEQVLVYEYVPNGPLSDHLYGTIKGQLLSFEQRVEAAIGLAEGLVYLHNHTERPTVHRDIKPSNVLLTHDYQVKIADFGLLREVGKEEMGTFTKVAGTRGYMDPDYMTLEMLTTRSDVYSFGVLLLELVTGREAMERDPDDKDRLVYITTVVLPLVASRHIHLIVDTRIATPLNLPALLSMAQIAAHCVQQPATRRPEMVEVVKALHTVKKTYLASLSAHAAPATAPPGVDGLQAHGRAGGHEVLCACNVNPANEVDVATWRMAHASSALAAAAAALMEARATVEMEGLRSDSERTAEAVQSKAPVGELPAVPLLEQHRKGGRSQEGSSEGRRMGDSGSYLRSNCLYDPLPAVLWHPSLLTDVDISNNFFSSVVPLPPPKRQADFSGAVEPRGGLPPRLSSSQGVSTSQSLHCFRSSPLPSFSSSCAAQVTAAVLAVLLCSLAPLLLRPLMPSSASSPVAPSSTQPTHTPVPLATAPPVCKPLKSPSSFSLTLTTPDCIFRGAVFMAPPTALNPPSAVTRVPLGPAYCHPTAAVYSRSLPAVDSARTLSSPHSSSCFSALPPDLLSTLIPAASAAGIGKGIACPPPAYGCSRQHRGLHPPRLCEPLFALHARHLPERPRARRAIADRLRSDCFELSPCARTRRYPWRFGSERSRVAVPAAQFSAMTAGTGGAGGSEVVESGGSGDSREWEMGEGRVRGGRVNIVPRQEAVVEKRAGTAAGGVRVGEVVRGGGVEEAGQAAASHMTVPPTLGAAGPWAEAPSSVASHRSAHADACASMEGHLCKEPSLLVFSGGTAFNAVAEELHEWTTAVAHVLPVSDDGGSTAEIVRVIGGPAIGDIRSRCLRLSDGSSHEARAVRRLLGHRLPLHPAQAKAEWVSIVEGEHELWGGVSDPYKEIIRAFLVHFHYQILRNAGHRFCFQHGSVGNFFFSGARSFFRSLDAAIFLFSRVSNIPQRSLVLPCVCTNDRFTLGAELYDGSIIRGQNDISHPAVVDSPRHLPLSVDKSSDASPPLPAPIRRVFYMSSEGTNLLHEVFPRVNPRVLEQITSVDAIIYGIGSLFTSICPSLILRGVGEAIAARECPKVLVLNGSVDRETAGMAASDFVLAICNCLNRTFGDDSRHRLTHSSMHYVTHLIAPEGGAIPLDHERLTYLGVTSVTMVPSLPCESSTGVHYDVHALVTTLKDLLTKQMASQVTT